MSAILEADLIWNPPGAALTVEVSIRIGAESVILFGSSGAGKTSILRLIAGLQRPKSGRIRLGRDILFDSARDVHRRLRDRRIGLIFQDDLLFPHLSVADNIRFGLHQQRRSDVDARMRQVAELCGVDRLLDRRPDTLSGGERQRVGLARALAPRPSLLLCDEPISALDLPSRDLLIDRLRAVRSAEGIPMLYVTHSPAEAIALGTRLILIEKGRVVAEGPPLDVLAGVAGLPISDVENRFAALVEGQGADGGETTLEISDGPRLIVPKIDRPTGDHVAVRVRADDILLARGPIVGLSARNILSGIVERVIVHGSDAEVLVRTRGVRWIVSIVTPAITALELKSGADVHMIIKARSCHVTLDRPKEQDLLRITRDGTS